MSIILSLNHTIPAVPSFPGTGVWKSPKGAEMNPKEISLSSIDVTQSKTAVPDLHNLIFLSIPSPFTQQNAARQEKFYKLLSEKTP